MSIRITPGASEKIAVYDFGSNAVLKGGIEFGAEPSKLTDKSGCGNDGVYTNITDVQLASGLWTWDFNGTSSIINCGQDTSLNITGSLSVAFWANWDADNVSYTIIGREDAADDRSWYCRKYLSDPLGFVVSGNGTTFAEWVSATIPAKDTWHFIVMVYTAGGTPTMAIYLNGVDDGGSLLAGTIPTSIVDVADIDLTLGVRRGTTELYDGALALPRIFPSALSPATITKMYNMERAYFNV